MKSKPAEMFLMCLKSLVPYLIEKKSSLHSACVNLSLVKDLNPCHQDAPVSHGLWKVKLKSIGVVGFIHAH